MSPFPQRVFCIRGGTSPLRLGLESEFEKHALAEGRTVSKRKYKHCMNMLTLKKWSLLT